MVKVLHKELDGTTLDAEKMFSINFTELNKMLCLSLRYNGVNSHVFVNGAEIIKFKAKDSEIVATSLCLGNISKDFSMDNMKKTGFYGYVYDFSVDYDVVTVNGILDIHKHLMKKHDIKCRDLLKKLFIAVTGFIELSIVNPLNAIPLKCIS